MYCTCELTSMGATQHALDTRIEHHVARKGRILGAGHHISFSANDRYRMLPRCVYEDFLRDCSPRSSLCCVVDVVV